MITFVAVAVPVLAIFSVTGIVAWFRVKVLMDAARAEGRRQAFRQASDLMLDRARVAIELAPRGDMTLGQVRAQVYDDAALELRCLQ